jgi:hypothetical protein
VEPIQCTPGSESRLSDIKAVGILCGEVGLCATRE